MKRVVLFSPSGFVESSAMRRSIHSLVPAFVLTWTLLSTLDWAGEGPSPPDVVEAAETVEAAVPEEPGVFYVDPGISMQTCTFIVFSRNNGLEAHVCQCCASYGSRVPVVCTLCTFCPKIVVEAMHTFPEMVSCSFFLG